MKPRKIALALFPVAAGRYTVRRVVVLSIYAAFDGALCVEISPLGKVTQHVLPFARLASVGPKLLARLRAKRAALSPRVIVPGSPAALETVAQAAREAVSA